MEFNEQVINALKEIGIVTTIDTSEHIIEWVEESLNPPTPPGPGPEPTQDFDFSNFKKISINVLGTAWVGGEPQSDDDPGSE